MDLSFRGFIPDLTSTLTPPRFPPFGFESDARRFTTTDGLHFSRSIIEAQANLLLNFRCNDVLSKKCPVDKTCRRSCPHLSLLHLLVITAVCLAAPAFWYYSYHTSLSFSLHNNRHIHFILVGQINPATWISDEHLPVFIVGRAVAFMYVVDRTSLWFKEQNQFVLRFFGSWDRQESGQ